jgi:peptide/nickel transport system ATP-binding protein
LLELEAITKGYRTGLFGKNEKLVLNDVSLSIGRGEIVGLIGESGCGKTTLGKVAMKLLSPTDGRIILDGTDVTKMKERRFRRYRSDVQIVFQNPEAALDPKYPLWVSIIEGIAKAGTPREKRRERLVEIAEMVGLPLDVIDRRPNQVSGGEIQRAVLARVLSMNPRYLIMDEPTSMLDVSVQACIMSLIKKQKEDRQLGILLISHDLDLVKVMCDRLVVMKDGRIVEEGRTEDVLKNPKNEHTASLIAMSQ